MKLLTSPVLAWMRDVRGGFAAMRPSRFPYPRFALALALGVAGGLLFQRLSLPLPWMMGPMVFCTLAALLRAPVALEAGRWCEESGVEASRLVLEVTEGQLLEATPAVLRQLAALRAVGARIAIDDFGSGYSSIAYLETFEFDIIKLDQGLLQGERTDRKLAMISWIAGLARMLDCTAIAEGIEDEGQAELARSAGIALGQGFLFGRPSALAALADQPRA